MIFLQVSDKSIEVVKQFLITKHILILVAILFLKNSEVIVSSTLI